MCDPYGRTHDVPNLFVADGSIFVTAGAMNPTATICAFALRQAEHIVETARLQVTGRMRPEARATLAGLADVLVPAADGMPSASEIGVHERWVDRAIAARPELADRLEAVLAVAAGRDPEAEIARLQAEEDEEFRMLLLVVTNAYYLSPKVRRLIGYPGQRAVEVFADQAEHDLRDGILDPVIARGSVWRMRTRACSGRRRQWQRDGERRSPARRRRIVDRAAVRLDDRLDDRRARARCRRYLGSGRDRRDRSGRRRVRHATARCPGRGRRPRADTRRRTRRA